VPPAIEEEVVVATQAVWLLVGAVGAVVLDQHREVLITNMAGECGVGLEVAFAAVLWVQARALW
jgi:hypothetical protein